MTTTILWFVAIWTAVSFPCGIAFCWLLRTKRIGFEPVEDRNEFCAFWRERGE